MTNARWKYVAILWALLFCFTLGGTAFASSHNQLKTVRLSEVVRSIFYAPQYVALELGFFEEEGLRIDMTTAWGADRGAAALISGGVDIGFFGPEAAVYIYQQGARDYLVGFAQLTAMDGSFLMARHPTDDFQWTDLRGQTVVGARPGGVPQMVLEWILRQHGMDPHRDVNMITNIDFAAAPGAFQAGLGLYIAQFEPTLSQMQKQGVGQIVSSLGVEAGPIAYTVYHARRSYIAQNPDVLMAFTRAIQRGMDWVAEHTPEEVAETIQGFFPDIDFDVLVSSVGRYMEQGSWNPTPVPSQEGFENLLRVMMAAGELANPVPFDVLMTTEVAEAALATFDSR